MPRTPSRLVRRTLALAAACALLAGCGGTADDGPGTGPGAGNAVAASLPPVRPVADADSITDVRGTTIAPARTPERVVCLVALCDDMLTELGMVPTATNSSLLAHPRFLGKDGAKKVPVIPGGFVSPEVEAILSHKPDLVIGLEDTHGKLAPALRGATTFWGVQPTKWEDSVAYLRGLAALTHRGDRAVAAEQRLRDALIRAEKAKSDKTALVVFGSDENFGVATPGIDVAAGLFPRFSDYPWKSRGIEGAYSLEEILAENVDVLFVETISFGAPGERLSEKMAGNALWSQIPAVKNGKVIEVDPEVWAKGRGTRSLGIVLDEATAALR
ncbi:ABC transporter substrate-binding protein [Thermomonospora umbrina]|uniref:Iron complex transport system substrate-binding protein n=1 Tax=Thermomonospora umbrina TaxID=111806 RepID=A0A3D9SMS4_9ACTN|nr:ABC transporter substrate-binding protein [Thermomonospora umbrina]REE95233.1 iron complex transport system substrate-binding protein [Thermomonospora umbrina]